MSGRRAAEEVLADLLQAGAVPSISGGRLDVAAPPGILTEERRETLAGCLPELRALVAEQWQSREECVARRPCRRMSVCAAHRRATLPHPGDMQRLWRPALTRAAVPVPGLCRAVRSSPSGRR